MSVNEVKLKAATIPFAIRGTGPTTSRTFCIGDEDHTLGNSLRHVLMQNHAVGFCGYSVPHPSEPIMQVRVQTIVPPGRKEAPSAIQVLKEGCQSLSDQCSIVLEKLESILPETKEDRLRIEQILLEYAAEESDEEEMLVEEDAEDAADDEDMEEVIEDAADD